MKDKFRFLPHTIGDICLLGDALEHKTKRNNPLTVVQQVTTALYFFASGKQASSSKK